MEGLPGVTLTVDFWNIPGVYSLYVLIQDTEAETIVQEIPYYMTSLATITLF